MCTVETKQCKRCEAEKPIIEYYGSKRSYCIECERVDARERMKKYGATLKGKASQALQTSRKTIRKLDIEIFDDLSLMDVVFTLAASDGECVYCEKDVGILNLTIDHIVPLIEGGENTLSNIQPACRSCNSAKHTTNLLEWHMRSGRTTDEAVSMVISKMASRRGVSPDIVRAELAANG